jgi:transposase
MWYVGLDFHQLFVCICILNEFGRVVKRMTIKGRWPQVVAELEKLKHPMAICFEASCGYGHLYEQLSRFAERVVVAHPGHLRLIYRSKRKNDRVDAEKLAKLLYADLVPAVYVPDVNVRDWRALIQFRNRLIARRTRTKNALRAVLRGHGLAAPARQSLWTGKGRAWLAGLELPTLQAALQRDLLLEEFNQLTPKIQRVEQELNKIARRHPGVLRLRTIPGVGPRTAEAVVAWIDNPRRFARNKQIGTYFGLVPCQDQSAQANRLGHITRDGPGVVRKLLTEASWQGIRHCPEIRAYFERIQGQDPDRKKIALVATAHYLLRVMLAMLRDNQPWRGNLKNQKVA